MLEPWNSMMSTHIDMHASIGSEYVYLLRICRWKYKMFKLLWVTKGTGITSNVLELCPITAVPFSVWNAYVTAIMGQR